MLVSAVHLKEKYRKWQCAKIGTEASPCARLCCNFHIHWAWFMIRGDVMDRWLMYYTHSGAKYPVVPNTRVEIRPLILSEPIFASPKSETLALKSWSSRTLLHLKSLWMTDGVVCSCMYSKALAQSRAILNLTPQFNEFLDCFCGLWRCCCSEPLGI